MTARTWFAGVLAVAGCNQLFGNNQVKALDANIGEPGLDAPVGTMTVMYAVEAGPDQIATAPMYVPFDTQVHVGPIDTQDPSNLEARTVTNGTFTIRFETLLARYRMIFTAPDGLDVEIQSQLTTANIVIPRVGRLDRGTVASGSLVPYAFSGGPDNSIGSWKLGRFFGTGLWSVFELGPCCSLGQTSVDYSKFRSMSGALGVPTSTDTIVFTDSISDGSPLDADHNTVSGYATAVFNGFDASGAPIGLVESAWKTPPLASLTSLKQTSTAFQASYASRAAGLLNLGTVELPEIKKAGGVIPAPNVMPFTEILLNQNNNSDSVSGDLDHLVFVPLAHSLNNPIRFANPYNGSDAPMYPTAVLVRGSTTRTFTNSTATVRSGIQALALQTNGSPEINIGDGVGLASNVSIKPSSVTDDSETILLLADPDAKQLARNAAATNIKTFDFWFASDTADTTATIDDCSITIYQIAATSITPVKRYLTAELPTRTIPLVIDQGAFDSTHEYAFGISCYHGHPMVKTGDWRTVVYPVAASTIYTKSFKVP